MYTGGGEDGKEMQQFPLQVAPQRWKPPSSFLSLFVLMKECVKDSHGSPLQIIINIVLELIKDEFHSWHVSFLEFQVIVGGISISSLSRIWIPGTHKCPVNTLTTATACSSSSPLW